MKRLFTLTLFVLLCFPLLAQAQHNVSLPPCNATGDGVTDDTSAIQTCIDLAQSGPVRSVFYPQGQYYISRPLHNNTSNVKQYFDDGAIIAAHFAGGPAMLNASPRKALATVPALVTGSGMALRGDAAPNYLDVSEGLPNLSGPTFTLRFFINVTDIDVTQITAFLSSQGRRSSFESVTSAFNLLLIPGPHIDLRWRNNSGGETRLFAPINLGVHHVAIQLSNGTLSLFIDGVPTSTYIKNLKVNQRAEERVIIGGAAGDWPDGGMFSLSTEVAGIDSISFHNAAKYPIEGFTPVFTKHEREADTLLLLNDFATVEGSFVKGETNQSIPGNSASYAYFTLPFPDFTQNPVGQIGQVGVFGAHFNCHQATSGIQNFDSVVSRYEHISMAFPRRGYWFRDAYGSRLVDLKVQPAKEWAMMLGGSDGVLIDSANLLGGTYTFIATGATGGDWRNFYLTPTNVTKAVGLLHGGNQTMTSLLVVDEGNSGTALETYLHAADFTSLTLVGGQAGVFRPVPFLTIDAGGKGRALMLNTAFFAPEPGTVLFHVIGERQGLVTGSIINWYSTTLTNSPNSVQVSQ